jgi:hypothetical protein
VSTATIEWSGVEPDRHGRGHWCRVDVELRGDKAAMTNGGGERNDAVLDAIVSLANPDTWYPPSVRDTPTWMDAMWSPQGLPQVMWLTVLYFALGECADACTHACRNIAARHPSGFHARVLPYAPSHRKLELNCAYTHTHTHAHAHTHTHTHTHSHTHTQYHHAMVLMNMCAIHLGCLHSTASDLVTRKLFLRPHRVRRQLCFFIVCFADVANRRQATHACTAPPWCRPWSAA